MIELDREEVHAEIIRKAGAIPAVEREGLVWFIDPLTKSTLILESENLTSYNVIVKIAESRLRFAKRGMISRFYPPTETVLHASE